MLKEKDATKDKYDSNRIPLTSDLRTRLDKRFNDVVDEEKQLAVQSLYDKCQVPESKFKNYRYESSTKYIDWITLYNIANGLHCTTDYLLGITSTPDEQQIPDSNDTKYNPHSAFRPGYEVKNVTQPIVLRPSDEDMFTAIYKKISPANISAMDKATDSDTENNASSPKQKSNYNRELLHSIYSVIIAGDERFIIEDADAPNIQLFKYFNNSFICKDYNIHCIPTDTVIQLIESLHTINKDTIDIILSSRNGYRLLFSGRYHTALINTFDLLLYYNLFHEYMQHPLIDVYVQEAHTIVKTLMIILEDNIFLSKDFFDNNQKLQERISKMLLEQTNFSPSPKKNTTLLKYFCKITFVEAQKNKKAANYDLSIMLYLKFIIFYLQSTNIYIGIHNLMENSYRNKFIESLKSIMTILNIIVPLEIPKEDIRLNKYKALKDLLTEYDLNDSTDGLRNCIYDHIDSLILLNAYLARDTEPDQERL